MIIGICGFQNSGKGSVGDILERRGFRKDSFAAPLKDAASVIFGWDRKLIEGDTKQSREWRELPDAFWSKAFNRVFTPREALQLMGTEVGRQVFHEDLWIHSLFNRAKSSNVYTVITDVRFRNEIRKIREYNGIVIRVKRGNDPDWYPVALRANSGDIEAQVAMKKMKIHVSEWDWIGSSFDFVIENNGTLDDLEKNIMRILTSLF